MSDSAYTGRRYDEMPSLWDGFANLVRPGLGLTAFGANVMNLPPTTRPRRTTSRGAARRSSTSRSPAPAPSSIGEERSA